MTLLLPLGLAAVAAALWPPRRVLARRAGSIGTAAAVLVLAGPLAAFGLLSVAIVTVAAFGAMLRRRRKDAAHAYSPGRPAGAASSGGGDAVIT